MIFYHGFPPVLCPLLSACQSGRKVPWERIQKLLEQTSFPVFCVCVFSGNSGAQDRGGNLSKYSAGEPKCLGSAITHRTLFKWQPIYIYLLFAWKKNKERVRLSWRCLRKSCHIRFIHTWLCLLSQCIDHHMLLLLFFRTVSHFNIRIINCCLMTYDQIQMFSFSFFQNSWGNICILSVFYVGLALCFSKYFSRLRVNLKYYT